MSKKGEYGGIWSGLSHQIPVALISFFTVYWITVTIDRSMKMIKLSVDTLIVKISDNSVIIRNNNDIMLSNSRLLIENNRHLTAIAKRFDTGQRKRESQ